MHITQSSMSRPSLQAMPFTNVEKNLTHYDQRYAGCASGLRSEAELRAFLQDAIHWATSWHGLYTGGFHGRLKGKRVLELGAGDGVNAAVMAAFGAHVVAVELSPVGADRIRANAELGQVSDRVEVIAADATDFSIDVQPFDFVVGKAFLHHLTHEEEASCLRAVARHLRPEGEARFLEPCVNSHLLDRLRWLIPVPGRPSILQRKKFEAYKLEDPHPERDNSSGHYRRAGLQCFEEVNVLPLGGLQRLQRFIPKGPLFRRYATLALKAEKLLPMSLQMAIARSQTIIMRRPR